MFNSYRENTLRLDGAICNGCGRCAEVCPHGVFAIADRRATVVAAESCMECGACQLNCSVGAISVESGVGCATAMILASLRGKDEVSCGCS